MPTANVYARKQLIMDVPPDIDGVLIAINEPGGAYENYPSYKNWPTLLKLEFVDFEHDLTSKADGHHEYKVITDWHADMIMKCMSENLGKDFYIYCPGGLSRSMAIACFMYDFLGYKIKMHAHPNRAHLNKLVYCKLGLLYSTYFEVGAVRKEPKCSAT